jgi:hypothetical protein
MININAKWRISAAALVAAASLGGCGGSGGTVPPATVAPTPPIQAINFSAFVEQTFAANANSTPVSLDGVNFAFDMNNDPGEFDTLIMSGTFQ